MKRNYLKGQEGDKINVVLAACGFNVKKLLRHLLFVPIFRQLAFVQALLTTFQASWSRRVNDEFRWA